jgi:hypothetical protein
MTIKYNTAPKMKTVLASTIATKSVPFGFYYMFSMTSFIDAEGDPISIHCSNTTTAVSGSSWVHF